VSATGVFFSFEGIEGSGKTTQLELASKALEEGGCLVFHTREPGGTAIGEKIRSVLLGAEHRDMSPIAELLLIQACRAQLMAEKIRPELEQGKVVLCDRFTDATLAYQGYGRGLNLDLIEFLNRTASGGIEPDLLLLFDCPVAEGFQRLQRRYQEAGKPEAWKGPDRMEAEGRLFHEKVRQGYLALASSRGTRIRVLDATRDRSAIHQEVMVHIWRTIKDKGCLLTKSSDRIV